MLHGTFQKRVHQLRRSVRFFQLRRAHPQAFLSGEHRDSVGVNGACGLYTASLATLLSVSLPRALPILVLNTNSNSHAHDLAAHYSGGGLVLFCSLGLLQPIVAIDCNTVASQALHRALHHLADHRGVVVGLLEFRRGDPDGGLGGQRFTRLVQHPPRLVVRLEAREGQPQIDVLRAALHRTAEQHPCILLAAEIYDRLPQTHRVGDVLQSLAKHATLAILLVL
mmetsp:Transcript_22220/g.54844  ORF Transcript_22220/g.54844 Transcript_22220/m.54844 type:complete len:224 (+) Transcript_22220:1091-1762(+)